MQPIVADKVAWSVCLHVCLLVTSVGCAKTAEQIEMRRDAVTNEGLWQCVQIPYSRMFLLINAIELQLLVIFGKILHSVYPYI